MLNVSEETVRRWIRNGELKAKQDGKSYLIDKNELIDLVKKQSQISGTAIAKMSSLAGVAGIAIDKIIESINKKEQKKPKALSLQELDYEIEKLNRQKKKLELEHQMKLLEIDEEISRCYELKMKIKE